MKRKSNIFVMLSKLFFWVVIVGYSTKIEEWSKRNRKLSRTLSYIFFPISIPLEIIDWKINKMICLREIDDAKKNDDEHRIYSMCYHYMKFVSRINKPLKLISKKQFSKIIEKHKIKLYNYCIDDKNKTDCNSFKSHLGMYGYGIKFYGGAVLEENNDTIIKVNEL